MDENCLCQFKVAGMKFWLGLTQVNQGRFQLRSSQLTITGNECCGVILGGEQQFMVEGGGGHHAGGIAAGDEVLRGQVKAWAEPAQQAAMKTE